MRLRTRAYAAILVSSALLGYAVWLGAEYARYFSQGGIARDPYGVVPALERYRAAGRTVPAGTVLGYFSDIPPSSPERPTRFATARYAVAPAVLQSDAARTDVVLVDLREPTSAPAILAAQGLRVLHDAGKGVYICRRNPR